jgi:hypothetical protein
MRAKMVPGIPDREPVGTFSGDADIISGATACVKGGGRSSLRLDISKTKA